MELPGVRRRRAHDILHRSASAQAKKTLCRSIGSPPYFSLRWHYPGQVHRVICSSAELSGRIATSPYCHLTYYIFLQNKINDETQKNYTNGEHCATGILILN
jgi:hypothetical protein